MKFLQRIHNRLGDFWWYSLMLFCACRAADLLNAFVGLWLVPKYVEPSELGAVMPLANFANFLAIPAAAFANTFRNELTRLSVSHEYGKLKSLMRGVFVATAIFLFAAIIIAHFALPAFLERIRIVEGSLGFLIIVSSFVGTVCPIYSNALQALKKFKAQSIINIVCAPVRFITMILTMPFRALSGYFVGQTASPAFMIFASVIALRKELSIPADPYWNRNSFKKFITIFLIFVTSAIAAGFSGLVETTIIRQRLPELDSAGYYMATRFSEIASFVSATLSFTIFPFASEKMAKGEDVRPMIFKATIVSFVFSATVAFPFFFIGRPLLSILPHGEQYSTYWWAIPWLIGISALGAFTGLYVTAQISANRFGYLKWYLPLDLAYPILLLVITGYGYFSPYIPSSWNDFLSIHNVRSLDTMLWWITVITLIKTGLCLIVMMFGNQDLRPRSNQQE